jgi:hypothetical protein
MWGRDKMQRTPPDEKLRGGGGGRGDIYKRAENQIFRTSERMQQENLTGWIGIFGFCSKFDRVGNLRDAG